MSKPISRRFLIGGAAPAMCSACAPKSDIAGVPQLVRTYFLKGADLNLTRADIEKIPYASLAVRMGDGAQALLILGRYDGDELNWISAEREVVVTRHGRVVKTYGLPADLRTTIFLTPDPVGEPSDHMAEASCLRTIDIEPQNRDGIVVRSTFTRYGPETIELLGTKFSCDHWQESGNAPDLSWSFTNDYWIDAHSGYVWKSRQFTAPGLPPLELEVFRPAA